MSAHPRQPDAPKQREGFDYAKRYNLNGEDRNATIAVRRVNDLLSSVDKQLIGASKSTGASLEKRMDLEKVDQRIQRGVLTADQLLNYAEQYNVNPYSGKVVTSDKPRPEEGTTFHVMEGVDGIECASGAPEGVYDGLLDDEDDEVRPMDLFVCATKPTSSRAKSRAGRDEDLIDALNGFEGEMFECRSYVEQLLSFTQRVAQDVVRVGKQCDSPSYPNLREGSASLMVAMNSLVKLMSGMHSKLRMLRHSVIEREDSIGALETKVRAQREHMLSTILERDALRREVWQHRACLKFRNLLRRARERQYISAAFGEFGGTSARKFSDVFNAPAAASIMRRPSGSGLAASGMGRRRSQLMPQGSAVSESAGGEDSSKSYLVHISIENHATLWGKHKSVMPRAYELFDNAFKVSAELMEATILSESDDGFMPDGIMSRGGYRMLQFTDGGTCMSWCLGFQYMLMLLPWPKELLSPSAACALVALDAVPPPSPGSETLMISHAATYLDDSGFNYEPFKDAALRVLSKASKGKFEDETKVTGIAHAFYGLRVRMGVHFGALVSEYNNNRMERNYFGDTAMKASIMCSRARGGEIVCTQTAMGELKSFLERVGAFQRPRPVLPMPLNRRDHDLFTEGEVMFQVLPAKMFKRTLCYAGDDDQSGRVHSECLDYNIHWWNHYNPTPEPLYFNSGFGGDDDDTDSDDGWGEV